MTLSVKFGLLRGPAGTMHGYDSRPAAVKTWCAYSLASQPSFRPLVGVKSLAQLDEALGAVPLEPSQLEALERLVPPHAVVGSRYGEAQMKQLDSER